MLIVLGVRVYDDATKAHGIEKMLDVQLLHQGQVWRRQRNLYLTTLALLTWYSVMVVHSLQVVLVARDQALLESVKNKNVVDAVRHGDISGIRSGGAQVVADDEEEKSEVAMQPRQRSTSRKASRKDR